MAAGKSFVHENLTPDLRNGTTCIFIDDRSFSANTPEGLFEKEGCGVIGVIRLVRLVCWSILIKPSLLVLLSIINDLHEAGVDDALVTDQWEILGVTAALTRRRESVKEQSRLDAAVRTIHLLSTLQLGYLRFHDTAECVYGWTSRVPTQRSTDRAWAALLRGRRSLYRASKYLRNILVGGLTHVGCLVGVNLRVVHYLKHHFQLEWDARRGSPLHALKQWLDDKGWQIQQPWVWVIQGCFCKVDLRLPDVDWASELQHRLCDGWRWFMFVKFLDQDRHDNQDFEYTIQDFLHFFKGMRELLDVNPSFRTVLLGAACSPVCFQDRGPFNLLYLEVW